MKRLFFTFLALFLTATTGMADVNPTTITGRVPIYELWANCSNSHNNETVQVFIDPINMPGSNTAIVVLSNGAQSALSYIGNVDSGVNSFVGVEGLMNAQLTYTNGLTSGVTATEVRLNRTHTFDKCVFIPIVGGGTVSVHN